MSDATGCRLRIACDSVSSTRARVWLNDMEITSAVRAVSLSMVVGELNTATLSLFVRDLVLDADVQAELRAALLPGAIPEVVTS